MEKYNPENYFGPNFPFPRLAPYSNPDVFYEYSESKYSFKLKDLLVSYLNQFNVTKILLILLKQTYVQYQRT